MTLPFDARCVATIHRQSFRVGKLNLVDLAGSERVRLTGATGQRLEESKKINQACANNSDMTCVTQFNS